MDPGEGLSSCKRGGPRFFSSCRQEKGRRRQKFCPFLLKSFWKEDLRTICSVRCQKVSAYKRKKSGNNKKPVVLTGFFGGERWIRTIEVGDNRFTVCPLWPLGNLPSFLPVRIRRGCRRGRTSENRYLEKRKLFGLLVGAGERSRTINLLITNQLICH